jgi:hypothetical protein
MKTTHKTGIITTIAFCLPGLTPGLGASSLLFKFSQIFNPGIFIGYLDGVSCLGCLTGAGDGAGGS